LCHRISSQPDLGRGHQPVYQFSHESEPANRVNVTSLQRWPNPELLQLDESQFNAVQMALSKEFAIVQGPPGTGKTYIGLKIVKALLS
jgi:superfamily II DNA or RNA helicase